MKFSFASIEDEEQIRQILEESGLLHRDIRPAQLQHFLIIKDDHSSALAGVVGLQPKGDVGLLRSLAVAKAYRRRGLGIELVRKIEEYARSQQIAVLYLLTLTADGFFARLGYQETDRASAPPALQETTEFKSLCPQTAVCMEKCL